MEITMIPQAGLPGQPETTLHVVGSVLTVNGQEFSLSGVPEGGSATPGGPIVGEVTRQGGVLRVRVLVQLDDTAADHQPAGAWVVNATGGEIAIPAVRRPEPEGE